MRRVGTADFNESPPRCGWRFSIFFKKKLLFERNSAFFQREKKNNRYFSSSVSPSFSDERNTQTSLLSICYEKANARKGLRNMIAPQAKSLITQCKSPVAFVFKPFRVTRTIVEHTHTHKMKWYKEIFAIGNQQQYPYISFQSIQQRKM